MARSRLAAPPTLAAPALAAPGVPALPPDARAAVLAWFDERGRALAFRGTRDPYAILVSEVMAQQTQISRVLEAWSRFLETFPTVETLAAATPADVLRAWRGMGYDRRALNLRRAARLIVDEHGGQVPSDLEALKRLPGVGPYTARAVASIAFGAPVGAVDTNVRRVLGRALAGHDAAALPPARLQSIADASVDPDRPGDWTHAVMDVGATICRPRSPLCSECPLRRWCRFATEVVDDPAVALRPARARAPAIPFAATTRWLRGRIVDRLRGAGGADWSIVTSPIGDHDAIAVRTALGALARDGIVELDPTDPDRARLATI
ncbi:MAG TPA: A/G-specific adenine glycosylase [Candidatus Limnocylindrales bacterium]|nr:A/G-specific adenine glycosylase [Candidatus Limnocylindrales bacterium]